MAKKREKNIMIVGRAVSVAGHMEVVAGANQTGFIKSGLRIQKQGGTWKIGEKVK